MAHTTPELMPSPLVPPVKMRHDPYNTETSCATESQPPTPIMAPTDVDVSGFPSFPNDSMNSMPITRQPLGEIQAQAGGENRFSKGVPAELPGGLLPEAVCEVSATNFAHHHHHHHIQHHQHHQQHAELIQGLDRRSSMPILMSMPVDDEPQQQHHHHYHHHDERAPAFHEERHHHHHHHHHHHPHMHVQEQDEQQHQYQHHHHHHHQHHVVRHLTGMEDDYSDASPLTLPESGTSTPLMHSHAGTPSFGPGDSLPHAQVQPQQPQPGVTRVVVVVNRRNVHPSSLYENVAPEPPQWQQDAGPPPTTPQTFQSSFSLSSVQPPPPPPPPPPLVDLPPASTHESAAPPQHHWSPQADLSFRESEVSLNQSLSSSWMPENHGSHARLTRTGSDSEGLTETPPSRSTARRLTDHRNSYSSRPRVEPQPPPQLYNESFSDFLVQVEFKFKRRDYYLASEAYSIGDHVKVDGDRGTDLGTVIHVRQICTRMDRMQIKTDLRVHSLASMKEVEMWGGQMVEEESAATKFMAAKAAQHRIPITVRNCEFQSDKRKLTCHYESQISHPDFRQLLKDGFHQYQCRIWMNNVTPGRNQRQQGQPPVTQEEAGWGEEGEDATVPDSSRRRERRSRGNEGAARRRNSGRGGRAGETWAQWS